MKKNYWLLGTLLTSLLLLIGLLTYSKYHLASIGLEKLAIEQLESRFPQSKLSFDQVDYFVGLNVGAKIYGAKIVKKSDHAIPIMQIKQITVRIPFWAIFFGGGAINLDLNGMSLFYEQKKPTSNWSELLSTTIPPTNAPSKKLQHAVILFAKNRININVYDIRLDYHLATREGSLDLKKVLIKNLNFAENTAFEIFFSSGPLFSAAKIKMNTLIVGHFNAGELIARKDSKFKVIGKLSEIESPFFKTKASPVEFTFNGEIRANRSIHLLAASSNSPLGQVSFQLQRDENEKWLFDQIQGKVNFDELKSLAVDTLFAGFSFNQTVATLAGSWEYSPTKSGPSLTWTLSPFDYTYSQWSDLKFTSWASGSWQDQSSDLSLNSRFLSGEMGLSLQAQWDRNRPKQMQVDWQLQDIVVPPELLTQLKTQSLSSLPLLALFPSASYQLNWKNIQLETTRLTLVGKLHSQQNRLYGSHLSLQAANGTMESSFELNLDPSQMSGTFASKLTDLPMETFYHLIPSLKENVSGHGSGILTGSFKHADQFEPDIVAKLTLVDGKIGFSPLREALIQTLSPPLAVPNLQISDSFDILSLNGKITHDKFELTKFILKNGQQKFRIEGHGYLARPPQTSELFLTFEDDADLISRRLLKLAKVRKLPINLRGTGLQLQADPAYTLDKLKPFQTKRKLR